MTNLEFAPSIDWSNFNSTLIIEVTRPDGVFTSTGIAINKDTILTAAHSLEGEVLKVRVSNDSMYSANGKFFTVKSFELHPDYNGDKSSYRCDIAKIKLSKALPVGTNYYPIMKSNQKLEGKFLRLGFGARGGQNIRTLVTPQFKDQRPLEDVLELHDLYSYSGDSGGPVFIQKNGQMFLVAIHSTLSFGPEGKHSFNPLLSSHRSWISN